MVLRHQCVDICEVPSYLRTVPFNMLKASPALLRAGKFQKTHEETGQQSGRHNGAQKI
jgi:hypothetical protein